MHIGSQILNDSPFRTTLNVMSKLIKELKLNLKYVDLGGGFGINYTDKEKPINLNKYSKLVHNFAKKLKCRIIFEPGRSIIGNTGLLISKIQFIKKGTNKNFIILDAGMNDFMRPALYEAFHKIIPISKKSFLEGNLVLEKLIIFLFFSVIPSLFMYFQKFESFLPP